LFQIFSAFIACAPADVLLKKFVFINLQARLNNLELEYFFKLALFLPGLLPGLLIYYLRLSR
jgi:hypothetical protein